MRRPGPRRSPGRRLFDLVAAAGAIVLLSLLASRLEPPFVADLEGRAQVADGDSLTLQGRRVRLMGIDAPELGQTCRVGDTETTCGRESRTALLQLIDGATVICSVMGADKYGRDLARCRVGAVDLNAAMVRAGQAVAFGDYRDEEAAARAENAGIWRGDFDEPAAWRRAHGGPAEAAHPSPWASLWTSPGAVLALLRRLVGV